MSRTTILATLALAVTATVARAQTNVIDQTATPQRAPGQAATAPSGETAHLDQAIAACLLLGNQEGIAVAQFAQEQLQSPEAKKFAETMINDHRQAIEKLQRVAPQLAALNLQLQGAPTTGADRVAPALQATSVAPSPMIALQQRIAQECLQLTQKELSEHEGADFDRCYIGQQIGAHVAMLAKVKGSQAFASPQLQPYLQEAAQMVEKHRVEAKKIAKSLMEQSRDSSGDQARRDARRQ